MYDRYFINRQPQRVSNSTDMIRLKAASPIYRPAFLYKIVIADSLQRCGLPSPGSRQTLRNLRPVRQSTRTGPAVDTGTTMLFNSLGFIFGYLPITLFGFFFLARSSHKMAALWLGAASIFFYGWWNPKFISLLLASICFNYAAGYIIGHSRNGRAKHVLVGSVAANLVVLAIFKYANFFLASVAGLGISVEPLNIILPIGISFFTFTQIAFLVDTYRGIAKEYDFIHYLLFVTWFPHLISGPVLHHKQMMPQFASPGTYRMSERSISVGLTLFAFGLFKKVIFADQFALFANPIFNVVNEGYAPTLAVAWAGTLAYALQLYFDFSGYSDMAIGLSRLFNVKLPLNFDSPYKSSSIIDFWRRWHITLSAFLRDYLYFPLGGNRKGAARRYLNLFITMLLGGLWHGAGWNFVLWGGLHGLYLLANHCWRTITGSNGHARSTLGTLLSTSLTFVAVLVAWVPFRSMSLKATLAMWKGMIGINGLTPHRALEAKFAAPISAHGPLSGPLPVLAIQPTALAMWVSIGLFVVWGVPNTQQWLSRLSPAWDSVENIPRVHWALNGRNGLLVGALLGLCVLCMTRTSEFLYFQF
jgi:alginate O-acetyltransferase complex protein AlgI